MDPVDLASLQATRSRLIEELPNMLSSEERRFLISMAYAEPDWSLLPIRHAENLPALRWKVQNLRKLAAANPGKFRAQAAELAKRLDTSLDV